VSILKLTTHFNILKKIKNVLAIEDHFWFLEPFSEHLLDCFYMVLRTKQKKTFFTIKNV